MQQRLSKLEAVALAVHLQDVDVVCETVQQRAGEALRSEHLGPLVEWEVGGHQDGAPFIALAEDLPPLTSLLAAAPWSAPPASPDSS